MMRDPFSIIFITCLVILTGIGVVEEKIRIEEKQEQKRQIRRFNKIMDGIFPCLRSKCDAKNT